MIIKINQKLGELPVLIETAASVELSGVYNGVGIQTDQGLFGIAQRDAGIEIMLDGKLVWASSQLGGK